jgi:hypothetical protein
MPGCDGTLARPHDLLRGPGPGRRLAEPEPTAAVIDSQSVRAADTVPRASRGWDTVNPLKFIGLSPVP